MDKIELRCKGDNRLLGELSGTIIGELKIKCPDSRCQLMNTFTENGEQENEYEKFCREHPTGTYVDNGEYEVK